MLLQASRRLMQPVQLIWKELHSYGWLVFIYDSEVIDPALCSIRRRSPEYVGSFDRIAGVISLYIWSDEVRITLNLLSGLLRLQQHSLHLHLVERHQHHQLHNNGNRKITRICQCRSAAGIPGAVPVKTRYNPAGIICSIQGSNNAFTIRTFP